MRYILFGGPFYYASGGANDLIAWGDDLAELVEVACHRKGTFDELDWWHVYDTVEHEIVVGTQAQAHQAPDLPTRIAVRTPN